MEVGGGRVRGGELNMELGSRPHHTSISPPTAACGTYPRRSPNVLGHARVPSPPRQVWRKDKHRDALFGPAGLCVPGTSATIFMP
jgi:hypothetical protein